MNNFMMLTADATTGTSSNSMILIIVQVGFLGLLLYFMLIRPQKKQQKKLSLMLSTIASGDSVLTTGGFYGVVIDVMDEIVIVEFGNNKNCRIPMKKSAVVEIEKPNTEK